MQPAGTTCDANVPGRPLAAGATVNDGAAVQLLCSLHRKHGAERGPDSVLQSSSGWRSWTAAPFTRRARISPTCRVYAAAFAMPASGPAVAMSLAASAL